MEVVEILVGVDTVKIMSIALVAIAVTILFGLRLLAQMLGSIRDGNRKWEDMAGALTDALKSQLTATNTLIDLTSVTSRSYDELARMAEANHAAITDMRERIESVIGAAGAVDEQVVAKLDAILSAVNHGR